MVIAEKGLDLFGTRKFKYFLRLLSILLAIFCLITLHEIDWDVDPYLSGRQGSMDDSLRPNFIS